MMAALHPKGVLAMNAIIGAIISALGWRVCNIDFCTLYTFITLALSTYEFWNKKH